VIFQTAATSHCPSHPCASWVRDLRAQTGSELGRRALTPQMGWCVCAEVCGPHVADHHLAMADVAPLAQLTALSTLKLKGVGRLRGTGLEALACMTRLTRLDVAGWREMTDKRVAVLAQGLGNLARLHLGGCDRLTDAVGAALEPLHLRELDLSHLPKLSDAGLRDLAAAPHLPACLKRLSLNGCVVRTPSSLCPSTEGGSLSERGAGAKRRETTRQAQQLSSHRILWVHHAGGDGRRRALAGRADLFTAAGPGGLLAAQRRRASCSHRHALAAPAHAPRLRAPARRRRGGAARARRLPHACRLEPVRMLCPCAAFTANNNMPHG
jgi:hypothetical protein